MLLVRGMATICRNDVMYNRVVCPLPTQTPNKRFQGNISWVGDFRLHHCLILFLYGFRLSKIKRGDIPL